jgi:hypothetical protein
LILFVNAFNGKKSNSHASFEAVKDVTQFKKDQNGRMKDRQFIKHDKILFQVKSGRSDEWNFDRKIIF